jgi:hypothetical protein
MFSTAVENAFGFLEKTHGFKVIKQTHNTVVYTTEVVEVSLFHDDQRSFEVGLGLSLISRSIQLVFSFEEILQFFNVPANERPAGYSARTQIEIRRILAMISEIMTGHASKLLDGNDDDWNRIIEQRRSNCFAYAAATSLIQAKRIVDVAWASHDYKKVVSVLEGFEEKLGKAEVAKLAYARRTLAKRRQDTLCEGGFISSNGEDAK